MWTESSYRVGLDKTLISFLSKNEISGSGARLLISYRSVIMTDTSKKCYFSISPKTLKIEIVDVLLFKEPASM